MEGVALRCIDTEDLRAAGAFLKISDVMLGKLLAQIEADHIKFSGIAHVCFVPFVRDLSCRANRVASRSDSAMGHYTLSPISKSGC